MFQNKIVIIGSIVVILFFLFLFSNSSNNVNYFDNETANKPLKEKTKKVVSVSENNISKNIKVTSNNNDKKKIKLTEIKHLEEKGYVETTIGDIKLYYKPKEENSFAPPSPPMLVRLKFSDETKIVPIKSNYAGSRYIYAVKRDKNQVEIKKIDTKKLFAPPLIGN